MCHTGWAEPRGKAGCAEDFLPSRLPYLAHLLSFTVLQFLSTTLNNYQAKSPALRAIFKFAYH